jgi:hypothetical protein
MFSFDVVTCVESVIFVQRESLGCVPGNFYIYHEELHCALVSISLHS